MLRYSIVVPVRDEQAHIGRLLDSLLSQRDLPLSVHIIDDGSSDRTPEILNSYVAKSPLVRVTTLAPRSTRNAGGESAIRTGFAAVNWQETEVLGRLDADVSFSPDYFSILLDKFETQPKLGIASGLIYEPEGDKWVPRRVPSYHTRGASKLYRRECYQRIQPIATCLGWDGQDEARANCYGWTTRTYEDAPIYHHRPVGTGVGAARFSRNLGVSAYYIGYHPIFLLARALSNVYRPPVVIGAALMLYGMVEGYLKKFPREDRDEVIAFVRRQQINRLLGRQTMWK
jgi:poly-beta-1,6-N-acetyl-D-glucosamine synthase